MIDINSNSNQSIWSSYIVDFETGMWNSIRDIIIAENLTGENFRCKAGSFFQINFIRASCYRYASIKRKDGRGICTKLSCGTQCCERHTRVCIKADGSMQIVQSDVTNLLNLTCQGSSFLIDPPVWLGAVEWMTPCIVSCPN